MLFDRSEVSLSVELELAVFRRAVEVSGQDDALWDLMMPLNGDGRSEEGVRLGSWESQLGLMCCPAARWGKGYVSGDNNTIKEI